MLRWVFNRGEPVTEMGLQCFLFFPLFDFWVCFNGLIGVMTVGMGLVCIMHYIIYGTNLWCFSV